MANPVAAVQAVATIGSAVAGSRSSRKAADAEARAAADRLALEREMFEKQQAVQQPFLDLGLRNLNRLSALYGEGGAYTRGPSLSELQFDPGYAFRLEQGQKALERSAAARGGLLSGSMLKGAQRFGQEMGSQEYQNAYARAMEQRAAETNALLGVGGIGPGAANQIGAGARSFATGGGNALADIGSARASGYLTQGNILRDVLSKGSEWYGKYYPPKP